MKRTEYINLINDVRNELKLSDDNIGKSKALGINFLKSYLEIQQPPIPYEDILQSITDSANDRGIDLIYFDDTEDTIKCYIIQIKYSEEGKTNVDENEVSKYLRNYNSFPDITGNINEKLTDQIKIYRNHKNSDKEIEKIGIYVNLGNFSKNAKSELVKSQIEIYDFDRINSEILLDEKLPDFDLTFNKQPIEYDENTLIGILNIYDFFNNENVVKIITDQSIFNLNVRGLMKRTKNSISGGIVETINNRPEYFLHFNNGITIICDSFNKIKGKKYKIDKGSVVNGQQTLRAILSIWSNGITIDKDKLKKLGLIIKLVKKPNVSNSKEILLNIAQYTNKQNAIKESDLYANEEQQKNIKFAAGNLAAELKYNYQTKRTTIKEAGVLTIKREEATILINTFINQNPSDSLENLYKNHYKDIFSDDISARSIIITYKLKNAIIKLLEKMDSNAKDKNSNANNWQDNYFKKFKKGRTENYLLYLMSLLLKEKFNINNRIIFLEKIYAQMIDTKNYDINSYFNNDFWTAYRISVKRFIEKIYGNNEVTMDFLRKQLKENDDVYGFDIKCFLNQYDTYIDERMDNPLNAKILVENL